MFTSGYRRFGFFVLTAFVLTILLSLTSCGGGGNGGGGGTVVNTSPTVQTVSPSNTSTNVSALSNITVTFSEIMDTTSVEQAFSISPRTAGVFSWNSDRTVMTFTPGNRWHYGTTYTCSIGTDAQNSRGTGLSSQYQWQLATVRGLPDHAWTKRMGGSAYDDVGRDIAVDPSGNVYVTGYFYGTVNFGADFGVSDSKTCGSTIMSDLFITKINANGTYAWTKRIGGSSDGTSASGAGIITDSSGNVYITGYFYQTVDFGGDFGTPDSKTSSGPLNVFITKIKANGTYAWTKRMGGNDFTTSWKVTLDSSGNIYVSGSFTGTVDFGADFGVSDSKTSAGGDAFITKINANGSYAWTKRTTASNSASDAYGYDNITDSSGNVYVAGGFNGTVDFGADFGVSDIKTAAGNSDIFVTKINANGSYAWTKRMGSSDSGNEKGQGITADPSGNVYVSGSFSGTVDFGTDFGVSDSKTSAGGLDIFITKINANGAYAWTKRMGGSGSSDDKGRRITMDSSGNLYVTGLFSGTVDFGADFGVSDIKTSAGTSDSFITRINANGSYDWTKRMGGSGSSSSEVLGISTDLSGNLYVTGSFSGTVDFGADFGVSATKTSAGSLDVFITKITP